MRTSLGLACCLGLGFFLACGGTSGDSINGNGTGADGGGGGTGADGGGGGTGTDGGGGGTGKDGGGGGPGTDGGGGGGRAIKTVFIIMMENHSWSTISASSSASYINNTLLPMGGHATKYSTPAGNHPSEPNYLWLEAGQNFNVKNDNPPSANHQSTTSHLVTQLEGAGVTWKAYAEGITDGTKCPLTDTGNYAVKHVPMAFFDDVTGTNSTTAKRCIDHIRPYTELATDLAGTTAKYNFIVPDLCNDMHGVILGCNGATDEIKVGDDWLKANVPAILGSAAYKNDGALFIIWDEGDEPAIGNASDGPVPVIVLSPLAKMNHTSTITYTHGSTLRTVEEIFGLPFLGSAATETDLSDFFTTF
jgi:hypothetical protein